MRAVKLLKASVATAPMVAAAVPAASCSNCPYWFTENADRLVGWCRFNPPAVIGDLQGNPSTFFPAMKAEGLCGRHPKWGE